MEKDLNKVYDTCIAKGSIVTKENIDLNKAKSILALVENELLIAQRLENIEVEVYTHLFKTYYDILRGLIDGFIIFDKIEISNHICLFSYMAIKHPELEFDWEILEGFRILRNRICYYGKSISKEDWKRHALKFKIYISSLKKLVEEKIKKYDEE